MEGIKRRRKEQREGEIRRCRRRKNKKGRKRVTADNKEEFKLENAQHGQTFTRHYLELLEKGGDRRKRNKREK